VALGAVRNCTVLVGMAEVAGYLGVFAGGSHQLLALVGMAGQADLFEFTFKNVMSKGACGLWQVLQSLIW